MLWTACLCPPKFICWNPNTQCDSNGKLGLWEEMGHESGALMSGISAVIKEALSQPFSHRETGKDLSEPEAGPHQTQNLASTLILNFLASRTVRNICLLFKPSNLWFCYSSPNRLRQDASLVNSSSSASYICGQVLIGLVVRAFDRLLIYSKMQFILKWHFQFI